MNTPEPTDSTGNGADPYRRDPYDPAFGPNRPDAGGYESGGHGGATDLLDFPPLPPYPDPDASGAGYPQAAPQAYPDGALYAGADQYSGLGQPVYPGADDDFAALTAPGPWPRPLTPHQPAASPDYGADPGPGADFGADAGPRPDADLGANTGADPGSGTGSGSGLRIASDAEATARLVIKLPSAPPQPSTTLRPHAV
ncbi:MAG: hypothetical protein ACRDSS_09085, partial [Actinocrinis sp.]